MKFTDTPYFQKATKALVAVFVLVPMLACSRRRDSELNEVRRLAFDEANKRYVLTDAAIESQYSQYHPNNAVPCPQEKPNESLREYTDRLGCQVSRERRELRPVPAVASVRGVELSRSSRKDLYFIKFDFEPHPNPHTELPDNQATAEKFERPDGTHYWVVEWK